METTDTKQNEMIDVIGTETATAAGIAIVTESEETAAAIECAGRPTEIKS
jgi:hypothetical protein